MKIISLVGLGDIIKKSARTWEEFDKKGIKILAADIIEKPLGLESLPNSAEFFNFSDAKDQNSFFKTVKENQLEFGYISNYPEVHLPTALELRRFTKKIIIPKPLDSNYLLISTLLNETSFSSFISNVKVHDHYRNKPVVNALKKIMPDLHRRYGYLRQLKLFLIEKKSTQDEWYRKNTLDSGLILDLGPHLVSILQELIPKKLIWTDMGGHIFERIDRTIEVVSCGRGRDNLCILEPGAETFALIHLRIHEDIVFYADDSKNNKVPVKNFMDVLLVMGKGVSVDQSSDDGDLKAIEMEFDGQSIYVNLDSYRIIPGEVEHLFKIRNIKINHMHKGINLPLQNLLENDLKFNSSWTSDFFQDFPDAWENASILNKARDLSKNKLGAYQTNVACHDLINQFIAGKFGISSIWQVATSLNYLIIGSIPPDRIP